MVDPGVTLTQINDEELTHGITHATCVIGNEYEMELIGKRIPELNTLTNDKIVITTLGVKGSIIKSKNKTYTISPVKVSKLATTTGAGDAWRGGFLSGCARNLDLQTCGQLGATAASFAVEHFGTQEQVFTVEEFQNRYRQTYNSLLKL